MGIHSMRVPRRSMGLCKHNPLQIWLDQSAVFSNNHIQVGHRGRVERPSVRVLIPSLPNIRPSLRIPVPLAQVLRSHRVPGLVARVVCQCIKRLNALPTHTSLHLRLPPMYSRLEHPYRKMSYTRSSRLHIGLKAYGKKWALIITPDIRGPSRTPSPREESATQPHRTLRLRGPGLASLPIPVEYASRRVWMAIMIGKLVSGGRGKGRGYSRLRGVGKFREHFPARLASQHYQ